jgi:hypothetical protein
MNVGVLIVHPRGMITGSVDGLNKDFRYELF